LAKPARPSATHKNGEPAAARRRTLSAGSTAPISLPKKNGNAARQDAADKRPRGASPVVEDADDDVDTKPGGFADDALEVEDFDGTVEDNDETDLDVEEVAGGSRECIDDPVRMYLMQMGEIPLLSRAQELTSARKIERTRARFRHHMLASDFVLHGAVNLLEKVRDGALRLDRTIEVSVTNTAEKKRILRRLRPNVDTLVKLLHENQHDFRLAISKRNPRDVRRDAWRRLVRRRNRAVRLIEELNLRTQRIQPLLDKLAEIAARMNSIRATGANCRANCTT
jgi:RNA polymerase primary sigma factor